MLCNACEPTTTTTTTTATPKVCDLVEGLDFSGADIMNVNSPSVSACMAVCMDKPKCVYFTYLTKGKKCFLKKAGVGQKNMQGAIGGDCSNVLTVQTTAAVETVPPEYLSGEGVRWLEYPRAPAKVQETVSVLVNGVVYS